MKPKIITPPSIEGASPLSALDLNKLHFSEKRTVLTPELLAKMAGKGRDGASAQSPMPMPKRAKS